MIANSQSACVRDLLGDRARLAGVRCECQACGGNVGTRADVAPEAPRPKFTRKPEPRYGAADCKRAAAGDMD